MVRCRYVLFFVTRCHVVPPATVTILRTVGCDKEAFWAVVALFSGRCVLFLVRGFCFCCHDINPLVADFRSSVDNLKTGNCADAPPCHAYPNISPSSRPRLYRAAHQQTKKPSRANDLACSITASASVYSCTLKSLVASLRPFMASAGIVQISPSIWSKCKNRNGAERTAVRISKRNASSVTVPSLKD